MHLDWQKKKICYLHCSINTLISSLAASLEASAISHAEHRVTWQNTGLIPDGSVSWQPPFKQPI